jgi:hypothetical protein
LGREILEQLRTRRDCEHRRRQRALAFAKL